MIIDTVTALSFIRFYKAVLLAVHPSAVPLARQQTLERLYIARHELSAKPSLLGQVLGSLPNENMSINREQIDAVQSLELKSWLYLRDTSSYSVFLDPQMERAYGVLGLTERIRDITGGSGAFIETGIVRLQGKFVCDGLISRVVWIGKNYKNSYSASLSQIRQNGQFHVKALRVIEWAIRGRIGREGADVARA